MVLISHHIADSRLNWLEWLVTDDDGKPVNGQPSQYQSGSTHGNFVDLHKSTATKPNTHLQFIFHFPFHVSIHGVEAFGAIMCLVGR